MKYIALWMVLCLVPLSVWSQASTTPHRTDSLVVMGAYNDFPPYSFLNEEGEPDGFQIELARAVMDKLGLKIVFNLADKTTLSQQFKQSKLDVLLAVDGDYPSKRYSSSFTCSYANVVLVSSSTHPIAALADLKGMRLAIATSAGTVAPTSELDRLDVKYATEKNGDCFSKLFADQYDAVFCFREQYNYYSDKLDADSTLNIVSLNLNQLSLRMMSHSESDKLIAAINKTLFELKEDGLYDRLQHKWLSFSADKEDYMSVTSSFLFVLLIVVVLLLISYFTLRRMDKEREQRTFFNNFFELILNKIPYPIYIKDLDLDLEDQYIFWNEVSRTSLGLGTNQAPIYVANVNKMGSTTKSDQKVYDSGVPYEQMEHLTLLNGREYETKVHKQLVLDGRKKYILVVRFIVNDLVEARAIAEQSERLKSVFLTHMSHDIRTPLNAIIGFTQELVTTTDPAEIKEYLSYINSNSELLLKLIGDIVDFSSLQTTGLEAVPTWLNINSIVDELEKTYINRLQSLKKDVRLIVDNPYQSCECYFDKHRLMQVLNNLVNNAIDYTSYGSIRIGISMSLNRMFLYVKDTGKGIAPEELDKLLSRLHSNLENVEEATDLGLSICKYIIENKGGTIGAVSEEGKGSIFWVSVNCEVRNLTEKRLYDWTEIKSTHRMIEYKRFDV
ncbi:MAG: transporter substrate-binding domain-containing protein [Bacteroidaceae bacterium]